MQEVIDGFHRAGERVLQILKQNSTSFVLVTAPNKASARGAEALSRELTAMGYHLDGIIFNRCLPRNLREDLLGDQSDDVAIMKTRVKVEDSVVSQLKGDIGRSQSGSGMWDVRVDDQSWDIHTLDGILAFSKLYSDL
jgi:anion-transporting  ArsA/GET3 family ATPase